MTRRSLAAMLLATSLAAGCARGEAPFEFGIRAVALNLAFTEPELAQPVDPNVIVQLIPAPPDVTGPDDLERYAGTPTPPPPVPPPCPVAPAGGAPREAVSFAVEAPPEAGSYPRHNSGTIVVTGGPFAITLPFPPTTTWDIGAAEELTTSSPLGAATTRQYDVRKTLSPGFVVTDRYELRADRVVLVRRTTSNGAGETVFEPSPPIDFFVFGQEGDSWRSGGVDLERGTSMVVQGVIESREIVDVCGELIDTFRVAASELMVDLATGDTSGTSQDDPNVYNIATHLGGLVVREDVHSTFATTDPGSGTPLVIELDYVSTVNAVEPRRSPR